MAEILVSAPFYMRQAATGFGGVGRAMDEALVDGTGRRTAFSKTTASLAFPVLVVGALTAWALGESGAKITFAGSFRGVTQAIPLTVFAEFRDNFDAAVALSVLVLGFASAVILVARYLTAGAIELGEG